MDRPALGQSLDLSVDMIAAGRPNRPGRSMAPSHITIHNTSNANAGADALAHARFVTETGFYVIDGRKRHVSWHYTVDDRRVVKHLPVNEVAFHAGSGNARSIAIEICMHAGIDQGAANDRAARLVAALMHDLGIPKARVVTHEHWTGKHCPVLLRAGFAGFVSRAQAHLDAIGPSGAEATGDPDELVTGDERTAIRESAEDGTEALAPELLEADDPHPGALAPEGAEPEPGV